VEAFPAIESLNGVATGINGWFSATQLS